MSFKDAVKKHRVRILTLDIETSAHTVRTYGLFKQNIGLNQVVEPGYTLCLAYKWLDETKPVFLRGDDPNYAEHVRAILSEADYVVTWNGTTFDIPHLQKDILLAGLTPPKPFKQIDLMRVSKKHFRFASQKLDWVAQQLGVGSKVKHEGFDLWTLCEQGDPKAWKRMEKYNLGDIKVTEGVLLKLLPWIPMATHIGLHMGKNWCCPNCGSDSLNQDGYAFAHSQSYKIYQCEDCGAWARGTKKQNNSLGTRRVL